MNTQRVPVEFQASYHRKPNPNGAAVTWRTNSPPPLTRRNTRATGCWFLSGYERYGLVVQQTKAMTTKYLHALLAIGIATGVGVTSPAYADSGDERCTAVREVQGSGEFSENVRSQLRDVGLLANGPLCDKTARVRLSRTGEVMHVEIALPRGGDVVRRRCTSAKAAAALIESHLSSNLTDDLLRAPLGLAAFPATTSNAPSRVATRTTSSTPSVSRRLDVPERRPTIAAFTTIMSGSDGSAWTGYDFALTTKVGPVVATLGAMIQDSNRVEAMVFPTTVDRSRKELRVGVGTDTRIGPVKLSPRVELGAAWLETKRIDADPTTGPVYDVWLCDGADISGYCEPGAPLYFGDQFSNQRTEFVATFKTTASLPIAGRLALTLGFTIDALPFASDAPIPSEWAENDAMFNPDTDPSLFALPANTRLRAGISVGLRLGL